MGAEPFTRDELCVVACAEAWRDDGEILASPIGWVPTVAARLAKLTFSPDLLLTDGEAMVLADPGPVGSPASGPIEGWLPFRTVFDVVWSGRRHVMMGAAQVDQYGNQNISCIGDWRQPKAQLIGVRGAPGNTVNHTCSYWVPNHSARVFVPRVDLVSGIGYDRVHEAGPLAQRHHEVRLVVTNLAVLDFATPNRRMRLRSVHAGVTVELVQAATGFPLEIPKDVPETPAPTDEQLHLIREVIDPRGMRRLEFPTAREAR